MPVASPHLSQCLQHGHAASTVSMPVGCKLANQALHMSLNLRVDGLVTHHELLGGLFVAVLLDVVGIKKKLRHRLEVAD